MGRMHYRRSPRAAGRSGPPRRAAMIASYSGVCRATILRRLAELGRRMQQMRVSLGSSGWLGRCPTEVRAALRAPARGGALPLMLDAIYPDESGDLP